MSRYEVLREASFEKNLGRYWLLSVVVVCVFTVVLIPVGVIWFVVGSFFVQKYIDRMSCTLTSRTLEIKKGMLSRVESTVPLEKITDLQLYQGPLMRIMGIHGFKVETAGQTAGPGGSLVAMVGIVDTPGFREAVLNQRDLVNDRGEGVAVSSEAVGDSSEHVLMEIRDSLLRIEAKLDRD